MSFLLLALLPHANAGIYAGNPEVTLHVDRPAHDFTLAEAVIDKVRVSYCGGGYTDYAVDDTVDLVATYTLTISGGDLCGVRVYWGSVVTIESPTFELAYDQDYTHVPIGSPIQPVALAPFTVVSGVIYGGNPGLYVSIHY